MFQLLQNKQNAELEENFYSWPGKKWKVERHYVFRAALLAF